MIVIRHYTRATGILPLSKALLPKTIWNTPLRVDTIIAPAADPPAVPELKSKPVRPPGPVLPSQSEPAGGDDRHRERAALSRDKYGLDSSVVAKRSRGRNRAARIVEQKLWGAWGKRLL